MYQVKLYHYHPEYRNGDKEETETIIYSEVFKTKKAVKSYILWQVNGKDYKEDWNTGNTPSRVWWFTGKTWVNENSGNTCNERYTYIINKV